MRGKGAFLNRKWLSREGQVDGKGCGQQGWFEQVAVLETAASSLKNSFLGEADAAFEPKDSST